MEPTVTGAKRASNGVSARAGEDLGSYNVAKTWPRGDNWEARVWMMRTLKELGKLEFWMMVIAEEMACLILNIDRGIS